MWSGTHGGLLRVVTQREEKAANSAGSGIDTVCHMVKILVALPDALRIYGFLIGGVHGYAS